GQLLGWGGSALIGRRQSIAPPPELQRENHGVDADRGWRADQVPDGVEPRRISWCSITVSAPACGPDAARAASSAAAIRASRSGATLVSDGHAQAASALSSQPTTAICSGTARP